MPLTIQCDQTLLRLKLSTTVPLVETDMSNEYPGTCMIAINAIQLPQNPRVYYDVFPIHLPTAYIIHDGNALKVAM